MAASIYEIPSYYVYEQTPEVTGPNPAAKTEKQDVKTDDSIYYELNEEGELVQEKPNSSASRKVKDASFSKHSGNIKLDAPRQTGKFHVNLMNTVGQRINKTMNIMQITL